MNIKDPLKLAGKTVWFVKGKEKRDIKKKEIGYIYTGTLDGDPFSKTHGRGLKIYKI